MKEENQKSPTKPLMSKNHEHVVGCLIRERKSERKREGGWSENLVMEVKTLVDIQN